MEQLLLVDDEKDYLQGLSRLLKRQCSGLSVTACACAADALARMEAQRFDLALLDVKMPGVDGLKLLAAIKERDPDLTVVMMTAYGTVNIAVKAMKQGAWDFITKPLETATLLKVIHQGLERNRLLRENITLKERLGGQSEHGFIGQSPALAVFLDRLRLAATSGYTVLVRGASGTGKEMAAHALHLLSDRRKKPHVVVNCPAIPEHLLESELFGHARGAFTGADRDHPGLFAQANGGTICLDEIGDIPPTIQTKLLRVIETGEIKPLGSPRTLVLDVRVVAMTNQDLEEKIRDRSFREDLFYRLNVLSLRTPTLREIAEDIPLLATHFLHQAARELDRDPPLLPLEAAAELMARPWPGNVRQLKNAMRRLLLFSRDRHLTREHIQTVLSSTCRKASGFTDHILELPYCAAKEQNLLQFSQAYFGHLLRETDGNVSAAARRAGTTRSALQKILKRFSIETDQYKDLDP